MSTVSSVDPNAYYTSPAPKKSEGLNMDTFLRLLTVQLATQNPLEPMKDSDMFSQISQLGQVQGMQNLQQQGDFTKAQSLIGQVVDSVTDSATGTQAVTGTVTGVTIDSEKNIKLNITQSDGTNSVVSLDSIQNIYGAAKTTEGPIPADYAYLIGKQVSGKNGTTDVSGQVTGLATSNGIIMADVVSSEGVKLQLPVGQITSIN